MDQAHCATGAHFTPSSDTSSYISGHILIKLRVLQMNMISFIDTGSEVSLIKDSVIEPLCRKNKIKIHDSDIIVSSVTNNNLDVTGYVLLPITTRSGGQFLHRFYIASNAHYKDALLLGSDFCHASNMEISCGHNKKVKLYNEKYSYSLLQHDETLESAITSQPMFNKRSHALVRATCKMRIAPNSVAKLPVKISGKQGTNWLVEDINANNDGFRLARVLRDGDVQSSFDIFCINSSSQYRYISANEIVGTAMDVDLLEDQTLELCPPEVDQQLGDLHLHHLDLGQQSLLKGLLREKAKVFSTLDDPIGEIKGIQHSLDIPEGQVSFTPQYRQPKACEDALNSMVKELLHYKVIRECESPYNSPILMVRKPDGSWRFCIDMRRLNAITPFKPYPIPKITDTVNKLSSMKFFSTLDAKSGYHHIRMKPEDEIKTAFRTQDNTYCFSRMLFGLCNAGFTYQMAMNKMLIDVLGRFALVYIDDILIYSKSFDEHLSHLRQIFDILIDGGVKLTMKKCHFARHSIEYLGFIVDGDGIRPNPKKFDAVKYFPVPTNQKQIKSFLATVGFYRHMIHMFSKYAAPLSDLLKKGVKFQWTAEHQECFQILKDSLLVSPILRHPDFQKRFEVHTDACTNSIAGILMQRDDNDGLPYPIAYFSRKLRPAEARYSVSELEALAIVASIKNYHYYLYGHKFTVVTDHKPLKLFLILNLVILGLVGGPLFCKTTFLMFNTKVVSCIICLTC